MVTGVLLKTILSKTNQLRESRLNHLIGKAECEIDDQLEWNYGSDAKMFDVSDLKDTIGKLYSELRSIKSDGEYIT